MQTKFLIIDGATDSKRSVRLVAWTGWLMERALASAECVGPMVEIDAGTGASFEAAP